MAGFIFLLRLHYWSLLGSGLQTGKTVGLVGTCLPPEHRKLPASSPQQLGSGQETQSNNVPGIVLPAAAAGNH